LIVMSPKSLLRHPLVASSLNDLTEGRWQPVIDDDGVQPENVTRLVLHSGKFYYDLIESEHRAQHPDVAIIRVEQLYPFPKDILQGIIERYPNLQEIIWAQEEPKNMGGWDFMHWRLSRLMNHRLPVHYVGRRRSASPAEGSKTAYSKNQSMIIDYAFNWKFDATTEGDE
jgi:2-oxoglutarate dehydrogenase E1 component